jgi:hypothetical protein
MLLKPLLDLRSPIFITLHRRVVVLPKKNHPARQAAIRRNESLRPHSDFGILPNAAGNPYALSARVDHGPHHGCVPDREVLTIDEHHRASIRGDKRK